MSSIRVTPLEIVNSIDGGCGAFCTIHNHLAWNNEEDDYPSGYYKICHYQFIGPIKIVPTGKSYSLIGTIKKKEFVFVFDISGGETFEGEEVLSKLEFKKGSYYVDIVTLETILKNRGFNKGDITKILLGYFSKLNLSDIFCTINLEIIDPFWCPEEDPEKRLLEWINQ